MSRIVEYHSSEQPHMSMSESLNYGLIEPLIYRDLDGEAADILAACCRRCGEVTLHSNKVASHLCTTVERTERLVEQGMQAFRRIVAEREAKCLSTTPCMYCHAVMPDMVRLNDGRRICRACAIAQSDCEKTGTARQEGGDE